MDSQDLIKKIEGMKNLGGHPRFYELLFQIAELHANKNHDYAKDADPLSNLKECERFGVPAWKGALVRITDKFARITQLASGKKALVKDEKMVDTLSDMSVYCLLTIILIEEMEKK